MNSKTIGVFFGSRSAEHDISIITAQLAISGLKGLDYNIVPVYISRDGIWMIDDELGRLATFTDPKKDVSKENRYKQYYLDLENSNGKLTFKKKGLRGKSVTIDLAFPTFHGTFGEDGTIQGLFEMFNVPYVGCDVASSALAMDKVLVKQMCEIHGIPTTKYIYFYNKDWKENKKYILERAKKELKFPVFVKPVHLGSSIGIAKVNDFKDLEDKIEVALYYDNKVLVEEGITDLMDVTCCLLGNEDLEASLLQESVFKSDFFDFDEKYINEGGAQIGNNENGLAIPARLDKEMTRNIQDTAKEVFKVLGCSGIARVDFLISKKTNNFYIAEVNPMPGTLYLHIWEPSGIDINELLKRLIELAENKHKQKQDINYSFSSSFLTNLNGSKLGKGKKLG